MSVHGPMWYTHRHVHPDGRGGEHDHVHTHSGDAAHAAHEHAQDAAGDVEALFAEAAFIRDVAELSRGRGWPALERPPERRPRGVWADGTPVTDADRDAVWRVYEAVSASRRPQPSGVYAALERPGVMSPILRRALGYGDV